MLSDNGSNTELTDAEAYKGYLIKVTLIRRINPRVLVDQPGKEPAQQWRMEEEWRVKTLRILDGNYEEKFCEAGENIYLSKDEAWEAGKKAGRTVIDSWLTSSEWARSAEVRAF